MEQKPDLKQEKDDRLKELRRQDQAAQQQRVRRRTAAAAAHPGAHDAMADLSPQRKEEARQAQEWKEKKWHKDHAYDDLFTDENMAGSSNQDRGEDWEDDFM